MSREIAIRGEWLREQVREILLEADPSAWRAEREEQLRRRVREVIAYLRARVRDAPPEIATFDGAPARLHERGQGLLVAIERALPAESTRSRWAAFVGEVHPEYEAFVNALGTGVAPAPTVRPTNYSRSAFHLASALVALAAILYLPPGRSLVYIAGAFVTYAWSMEVGRRVSPKLNDLLMRAYGSVAHPHERYRVNSATWYASALILLAAFSSRPAMIAGVVVLGVADPIAASVGRRYGNHKLRAGRSLEGTLAFFVSGSLAAACVLGASGVIAWDHVAVPALLAGCVGALAELGSVRLDDNFTIPVAVGAVGTLLAPYLG